MRAPRCESAVPTHGVQCLPVTSVFGNQPHGRRRRVGGRGGRGGAGSTAAVLWACTHIFGTIEIQASKSPSAGGTRFLVPGCAPRFGCVLNSAAAKRWMEVCNHAAPTQARTSEKRVNHAAPRAFAVPVVRASVANSRHRCAFGMREPGASVTMVIYARFLCVF